MNKSRIASIDAFRFFAILLVITIHAYMGSPFYGKGWWALVENICNLAVPYFFIVAGYFFWKSIQQTGSLKTSYAQYVKRILGIFVVWSLIYSFPRLSPETLTTITQHGIIKTYFWNLQYIWSYYKLDPWLFLTIGTNTPFWFLSALIVAVTIVTIFIGIGQEKYLLAFALLMYLFTPVVILFVPPQAGGGYNFNPKIGMFVATVFVAYGWHLSKEITYSRRATYFLLALGITFLFLEEGLLQHFYHVQTHTGKISYLLIAMGLVRWTLSNPRIFENTFFPQLGRLTLGIYCIHMLFLINIKPYVANSYLRVWEIIVVPLIYVLSLLVVLVLKKIPATRWLVA